MVERISTGIPGLDEMLGGGLIAGRAYLVEGPPGAGKTILAMHFAMAGVERGENALYVTLEEPADQLKEDMAGLGFNVGSENFKIVDATPVNPERSIVFSESPDIEFGESFERLLNSLSAELRKREYRRVVVDPITMVKLTVPDELEYRKIFLSFLKTLRRYNVTVLMTSELEKSDVEKYLVSGVIRLTRVVSGDKPVRAIQITKFRGSAFDEAMRPYRITSRGIQIFPGETVFV
ncbi:ATPase domain-containing protein [Thermococcus sp. AM4]|uniref:RAD55 family ATPase n=1 Tax=Thermococcus sp. (strain AM4) TaxID=246969 RepID=UPI0001870DA3|nr:ATPase domain-containing protein [Thermococcus sp. AM4]EEB74226.1 Circadian clock protein KaiC [Thermococcus sp. AM4]